MLRSLLALSLLALAGCTANVTAPAAPDVVDHPVATVLAPAPEVTARPGADVPAGAFLFFDDFEHGVDKWQLPVAKDREVAWRLLKAHTCSGDYSLLFGQAGQAPYTAGPAQVLVGLKAPLDLTKGVKPLLKFDLKGLTSPSTGLTVQAEVQGADQAWRPVGESVIADHAYVLTYTADLTRYAGQSVGLRFRAGLTGLTAPTPGVYLDDVGVIEPRS